MRKPFFTPGFLIVAASVLVVLALLFPAIREARDAARKMHSKNNLKQIGLAFWNYESTYGCFPIGTDVGPSGVAKHGPLTRCLPYFESSPLYSLLDLDSEWNHPLNRGFDSLQHWYLNIPDIRPTRIDGMGVSHYAINGNLMFRDGSRRVTDIEDAENTWMAGEVCGAYVPWIYPYHARELRWPLNADDASFGRPTGDGALMLFVDGSVRWFENSVDRDAFGGIVNGPVANAAQLQMPPRPETFANRPFHNVLVVLPHKHSEPGEYNARVQTAPESAGDCEALIAPSWNVSASGVQQLIQMRKLRHLRVLQLPADDSELKLRSSLRTLIVGDELIYHRD